MLFLFRLSVIVGLSALLVTTSGAATDAMGPGASGGGKSVVCRNGQGKILSAEVLDIFEGRILYDREYAPPAGDFRQVLDETEKKIKKLQVPWHGLALASAGLIDRATLLPAGTRLQPTDDALEIIVPDGCKLEQLAVYNLRLDRLFIDKEIWDQLDQLNRAALLLHEHLYSSLRFTTGETDSFYSRQVVGALLSVSELVPLYQPHLGVMPDKVYNCAVNKRTDGVGPALSNFYLYQSGNGDIVVQRVNVRKIPMFSQTLSLYRPFYLGGPGTEPITAEELAGLKTVPYQPKPFLSQQWFSIKNDSAVLGWTEKFGLRMLPAEGGSTLQLMVGYFRTGTDGDDAVLYPATCQPEKR